MFSVPHFGLFALSVLLINISPGATFVAVTSEAITKGFREGIFTAFGACCGLIVYAIFSWAGLSAFIIHSLVLFNIIKYAGIVYLLYCGIKAFLKKTFDVNQPVTTRKAESFKKGLFVNLLNPLVPVLFLTLIPQFVNVDADDNPAQILFMGIWICCSALTVNIIYALLFSSIGKYLVSKPSFWKWQGKLTGLMFLYLAVRFAFKEVF